VERGCLTELDYTLTDLGSWRPWLEGREPLADGAPILRGEISIETPEALRVATISNAPWIAPLAGTSHHWSFGPVTPIPDEGGLPEVIRIPSLVFSTCPSWETLGSWLLRRLDEASSPGVEILEWIEGPLASGRPPLTDEDRVGRTAWLIGERTAASDDEPLSWWLPIRPADRTFNTSCGNRLDRAALAAAALEAFGVSSEIALVPLAPRVEREVPALVQFGDIWWRCPTRILSIERGEAMLAPLAGHAEEILHLLPNETEVLALSPHAGSSSIRCRIVEEDDGSVKGQAAIRLGGAVCRALSHGDLEGTLEGIAGTWINGAEVAGFEVETASPETLAVVFSMKGESLGESAGLGRRRFRLPSAPGIDGEGFPPSRVLRRKVRENPLIMPMLLEERVHFRFEPRSPGSVVLAPAEVHLEASDAVLNRSSRLDGGIWEIERQLRIGRRRIEAGEYPGFRELLLERIEGTGDELYLGETAGSD
jgi:hypothetical protein